MDWPSIVTSIGDNDSLIVKIIENNGRIIHQWNVEWFDLWKNANHLPKERVPRSRPGTMIHGIVLLDDGSIVFNFENLGLICLNKDSKPLWRLPYLTHHSIYKDGNILWVCGQRYRTTALEKFPNYLPPFIEPMILKVSISGELLEETSVLELLMTTIFMDY